jgi:hypothetical protein
MGKKLDEAHSRIWIEAQHHLHLALTRDDPYGTGFANGFAEALRIIADIRNR